jgi:hypothetical protein
VLETLRNARASLVNGPYEFSQWERCTCGHIYSGWKGSMATNECHVRHIGGPVYSQALRAVVAAASDSAETIERLEMELSTGDLTALVSDWTRVTARSEGLSAKEAALKLLDNAIAYVEEEERQAWLEVAAASNLSERELELV